MRPPYSCGLCLSCTRGMLSRFNRQAFEDNLLKLSDGREVGFHGWLRLKEISHRRLLCSIACHAAIAAWATGCRSQGELTMNEEQVDTEKRLTEFVYVDGVLSMSDILSLQ